MSAEGSGVRRYLNDGDLLADGREYVLSKDYAALQAELQRERRDREHFQACWNSVAGMRDQIAALQSQLSAAIAEREGMRADAERYRWLRNESPHASHNTPTVVLGFRGLDEYATSLDGNELDAAIDALTSRPATDATDAAEQTGDAP